MKKIEEFYCIQTNDAHSYVENEIKGICKIKQELFRPQIFIDDYSLFHNSDYQRSTPLINYPDINFKRYFTEQELFCLSELFDFEIKQKDGGYKFAQISDDSRLSNVDLVWLSTTFQKEYVIIESKRWQFDYQPRSAGEDARGEDVTYIHGIWENPELPESIINKIKGEI